MLQLDIRPDQVDRMLYGWEHAQLRITEWARDNQAVLDAFGAMVLPALIIGGTCMGARHSLRIFIAQSQAPAPQQVLPFGCHADSTTSKSTRLRRLFRFVLFIAGLEALLLYALPMSPDWADGFWLLAALAFGGMYLLRISSILHPAAMRLTRTRHGRFLLTAIPDISPRLRNFKGIESVLAVALLDLWCFSVSIPNFPLKSEVYGQVVGSVITAFTIAGFQGARIRMKVIVAFLGLYPVLFLGLIIAGRLVDQGNLDLWQLLVGWYDVETVGADALEVDAGGIGGIFGVNEHVARMMGMVASAVLMGFPGWLAAIALRFDYSLAAFSGEASAQAPLAIASGPLHSAKKTRLLARYSRLAKFVVPDLPGVVLPSDLPTFDKPMYRSVVVTLAIIWTGLWAFLGVRDSMGFVAFSLPVVALVMIVNAWRRGVSKQFWGYTESWWLQPTIPTEPAIVDAPHANAGDLEKAQLAAVLSPQDAPVAVAEDKLVDIEA